MTRSRWAALARPPIGLRARFLLVMLTLVLVVLGGFVYAVSEFLDVLEEDMIEGQLTRDVDRVSALYARDPALLEITEPGLRVFVTERGDMTGLPPALRELDNGQHREVSLPDAPYEYGVTRRDIGAKSLYVLRDLSAVESLEKELIGVAWLVGLGALFLALLLGFWLSQIVVRPVQALAERVSQVMPGRRRPVLGSGTGDRQLDVIVEAFDGVLDRFDAFVAREQAFTEDASHELRTPLATVISSIDLIADDAALSDKSRKRLLRARAATARMHELIESLLLFAREQSSEPCTTPVSPVVREAIAMQEQMFSGVSERPAIVFDAQAEAQVNSPSSMLLSVVNNLLRNAIEHGGGAQVDVCLNAECLSIRDRGSGIAPAALSRMFDRRFRGEHSQGQGLGLYLVKRISERFGWRVEVVSTPAAGTRFVLYFDG